MAVVAGERQPSVRVTGNGSPVRRPDCSSSGPGTAPIEEDSMSDRVKIDVRDGVADVRLNRPEKMNALDLEMFRAIVDAGDQVAGDPSVRVVVLSGEGRSFCAGLDISAFAGGMQAQDLGDGAASGGSNGGSGGSNGGSGGSNGGLSSRLDGRITNMAQQVAHTWFEMPAPVIAAVHGVAFGGGIQIALGADIRIVAPDARLSVMEVRWGLFPDMTGPQTLPRLVGLDVAKELVFTGRQVSGREAVQLGLATRVADDPRAAAMELAAEIAGKNPEAIRAAKSLLNAAGTRPLAESYLEESRLMTSIMGSANQREAAMAFLEKRPPVFTDE
jgi:enoyl-CoA hydratase/carnithine racemase